MTALATAIFAILTDAGPVPVFHVETYDLCVELMEISLADAQCVDIAAEEDQADDEE
jgi:hypothetical protein